MILILILIEIVFFFSQPWLMVHEPVDLMFDSWYPTDFLSANIRHTVSALFSHPAKGKNMAFPLFNEFCVVPTV